MWKTFVLPPTPAKHSDDHKAAPSQGSPFLSLRGDVLYDLFSRSSIDTPYADNNILQHSIRANVYAVINSKLPIAIQFNSRKSNSYLFKDYVDANVQFDGHSYQQLLKQDLKNRVTKYITDGAKDSSVLAIIRQKQVVLQQYAQWLQVGRQVQQLIDSRNELAGIDNYQELINNPEGLAKSRISGYISDSLTRSVKDAESLQNYNEVLNAARDYAGKMGNKFSVKEVLERQGKEQINDKQKEALTFIKEYANKSAAYQRISKEIQEWEQRYQKQSDSTKNLMDSVKSMIDYEEDPAQLQKYLKKYGTDSVKPLKWIKHLMAIKRPSRQNLPDIL